MYVYPISTHKAEHSQIEPPNPTVISQQIQKAEKPISCTSRTQQVKLRLG